MMNAINNFEPFLNDSESGSYLILTCDRSPMFLDDPGTSYASIFSEAELCDTFSDESLIGFSTD